MADDPRKITVTPCEPGYGVTPVEHLAALAGDAERMLAEAVPANTRRAYRAAWGRWEAWAEAHGLTSRPAAPGAVALYLQELCNAGRRVPSIEQAAAAIAAEHLAHGLDSPTEEAIVRRVKHAARVRIGVAPIHRRRALDVAELVEAVAALPAGPKGTRDRALLLLGFSGALRRSELVALTWGDVERSREGLTLTIRASKGDSEGVTEPVGVPLARVPARCPVAALDAWRELVGGADATGPIFRAVDRHGRIGVDGLDGRAVHSVLVDAGRRVGLDVDELGAHSLRIGLINAAIAAGVEERDIMRHTRHRSIRVMRAYIRNASVFRRNAAGGIL